MANKRPKPEEIVSKLRQVEILMGQGMPRLDAIRQIGVVEQTYYRWKKKDGGMGVDQLKELNDPGVWSRIGANADPQSSGAIVETIGSLASTRALSPRRAAPSPNLGASEIQVLCLNRKGFCWAMLRGTNGELSMLVQLGFAAYRLQHVQLVFKHYSCRRHAPVIRCASRSQFTGQRRAPIRDLSEAHGADCPQNQGRRS